jgi:hypothetical protein
MFEAAMQETHNDFIKKYTSCITAICDTEKTTDDVMNFINDFDRFIKSHHGSNDNSNDNSNDDGIDGIQEESSVMVPKLISLLNEALGVTNTCPDKEIDTNELNDELSPTNISSGFEYITIQELNNDRVLLSYQNKPIVLKPNNPNTEMETCLDSYFSQNRKLVCIPEILIFEIKRTSPNNSMTKISVELDMNKYMPRDNITAANYQLFAVIHQNGIILESRINKDWLYMTSSDCQSNSRFLPRIGAFLLFYRKLAQ